MRCWLLWLLPPLLAFGQILLIVGQADALPDNQTIHIGYLLESMDRAGAINVAIERAQTDRLLPGYNFRYNDTPTLCSSCSKIRHSTM